MNLEKPTNNESPEQNARELPDVDIEFVNGEQEKEMDTIPMEIQGAIRKLVLNGWDFIKLREDGKFVFGKGEGKEERSLILSEEELKNRK